MMKYKLRPGSVILILLFSIIHLVNPIKANTTNPSVDLPLNTSSGNTLSPATEKPKDDGNLHQKTSNPPETLKSANGDDGQGSKSKTKIRKRKPKRIKVNKHMMQMDRSLTVAGDEDENNNSSEHDTVAHLSRTFTLRFSGESYNFEVQYLDETEINSPILKHYTLYNSNFYPPWSYHGFFPPSQWHEVPIEYFTRSAGGLVDAKDMKKHRSAMHVCSSKVAKSSKCYEMMENECLNIMPSPIDIVTEEATEDESSESFEFLHFDTFFGFKMFIPEDGTDLLYLTFLSPKTSRDKTPAVSGGSVGNHDLFLDRILFRIGTSYLKGSEHTIDGKQYGMEIQLYFTGDQGSYWESLAKYKFMKPNDPLLGNNMHVFSIMVSVADPRATKPDDENAKFASRFEVLSLAATMFWKSDNSQKRRAIQVTQKLISLDDFLGTPSLGTYYTYEGSLTHPPCLKHAKWTIFKNPIWITHEQWIRFVNINSEFSDLGNLEGNIRPMTKIFMKVDIPSYLSMREAQGLLPPTQHELDTEVKYRHLNGSKKELYVIKKYTDFSRYFARRVRKVNQVQRREHSSDDYYDTKPSGSPIHLTNLVYFCLIIPQTLLYNMS